MAHNYRKLVNDDWDDYEEREAWDWKQPSYENPRKEDTIDYSATLNIPNAVWIIPSHFSSLDILGEKNVNLTRISENTNAHMVFNKDEHRIEMWGDDLEEACHQWNSLAKTMLEERRKKSKGWGKPEKAPTTKRQKEKLRRRKEREDEANKYKTTPKSLYFPYYGYFVVNTGISITQFLGSSSGEDWNPLRTETKCHIWHEPTLPGSEITIRIAGNSYENVEEATSRVKNIFIKKLASRSIPDKGWVLHKLEPPTKPYIIRLGHPPSWLQRPYDYDGELRLIEPVYEGEKIPVVGEANAPKQLKTSFNLGAMRKISESNLQKIEEALVKALEAIHLHDQEIKMRVRFGHLCLMNFPQPKKGNEDSIRDKKVNRDNKDNKDKKGNKDIKDDKPVQQISWSVEKFNEKVLNHPRMLSKLVTHLASEEDQISGLIDYLSGSKHSKKWDNSPFREFKIHGVRKIPGGEETWPCAFDVQFDKLETDKKAGEKKHNNNEEDDNKKYKIGLWSAVVNDRNILDINMSCLNNYSWKLNIQAARCLSNGRFHPEGSFVHQLRFCPRGRLVYSNTREIEVESVCEKSKWKYWWNDDYIVEVTKYEFWDLLKFKSIKQGTDILLSREPPPKVSYGVTLYKRSWDEDFSHNRNLKLGEVPEWHPDDFKDEEKGVKSLLIDIQNFLKELGTYLPMRTC